MFTAKQHTLIATVLILVISYFIRLSSIEIQPWDEGLYAVRGEMIVKHGAVWDQTDYAIGGLYSSSPAPMTSWHVAIGILGLGRTTTAVRLIGILDAGIALLFLYGIVCRYSSHRLAITGVVLCGTSLHWVLFGRQAMSEVPLMTYTLVALWACIRLREALASDSNWKRMEVMAPIAVYGIGLGFAMLTKLSVGALPLLFAASLIAMPAVRKPMLGGVAIGFCIAMPWYISMIAAHGEPFLQAILFKHATTVVEGNSRALGILYYFNQLVVTQPWLVLALLITVTSAVTFGKNLISSASISTANWVTSISWLWFVLTMVVLTVAPTKNPHYVVVLIPPAIIVSLNAYNRILQLQKHRLTMLVWLLLLCVLAWSAMPSLRVDIRQDPMPYIPMLGVVLLCGALLMLLPKKAVAMVSSQFSQHIITVVLAVSVFNASRVVWKPGKDQFVAGGREVATELLESGTTSFTYLYHEHNKADSLNPQLAWYTAGWMLGQEPGLSYHPVAMPEQTTSLDALAQVAFSTTPYVVYYHTNQADSVQTNVLAALSVGYSVLEETPNYTLLSKNH